MMSFCCCIAFQVSSEFVKYDDNDNGNTNGAVGAHPYGPSEDKYNTKIYYCYYEPGIVSFSDTAAPRNKHFFKCVFFSTPCFHV